MRTYKRTTTRGTTSIEVYELAALEIIEKKRNYRDVAKEFELCYVSLFNFVKKKKTGAPVQMDVISQMSCEPIAGPSGMQKGGSDFAVETIRPLPKVLQRISDDISQMSCEPVAGPSRMQKGASDFAVETIRPLPKAPPRITSNRKRAKKSAILTDTPEKNALEEEHNIREMKKRKITSKHQNKENKRDKGKGKGKGKGKAKGNVNKDEKVRKVKKRILNESNSSNDDYFCIICGASYNEDTSGGEWIECISCKDWAQAGCIKGDITVFCCLNCNSDDEYE